MKSFNDCSPCHRFSLLQPEPNNSFAFRFHIFGIIIHILPITFISRPKCIPSASHFEAMLCRVNSMLHLHIQGIADLAFLALNSNIYYEYQVEKWKLCYFVVMDL